MNFMSHLLNRPSFIEVLERIDRIITKHFPQISKYDAGVEAAFYAKANIKQTTSDTINEPLNTLIDIRGDIIEDRDRDKDITIIDQSNDRDENKAKGFCTISKWRVSGTH